MLPNATGPFKLIVVTRDTVTIDEGFIPNNISIDRATAFLGDEIKRRGLYNVVNGAQEIDKKP